MVALVLRCKGRLSLQELEYMMLCHNRAAQGSMAMIAATSPSSLQQSLGGNRSAPAMRNAPHTHTLGVSSGTIAYNHA